MFQTDDLEDSVLGSMQWTKINLNTWLSFYMKHRSLAAPSLKAQAALRKMQREAEDPDKEMREELQEEEHTKKTKKDKTKEKKACRKGGKGKGRGRGRGKGAKTEKKKDPDMPESGREKPDDENLPDPQMLGTTEVAEPSSSTKKRRTLGRKNSKLKRLRVLSPSSSAKKKRKTDRDPEAPAKPHEHDVVEVIDDDEEPARVSDERSGPTDGDQIPNSKKTEEKKKKKRRKNGKKGKKKALKKKTPKERKAADPKKEVKEGEVKEGEDNSKTKRNTKKTSKETEEEKKQRELEDKDINTALDPMYDALMHA